VLGTPLNLVRRTIMATDLAHGLLNAAVAATAMYLERLERERALGAAVSGWRPRSRLASYTGRVCDAYRVLHGWAPIHRGYLRQPAPWTVRVARSLAAAAVGAGVAAAGVAIGYHAGRLPAEGRADALQPAEHAGNDTAR
jgi:hypothetical protein